MDASSIALSVALMQPGEGKFDHCIYFSSHKLYDAKKNYTTKKGEGLDMIYAL